MDFLFIHEIDNFEKTGGQFHQHIYMHPLHPQIPKAQKAAWFDCLFMLLGSASVKATRKMLVKLTPGGTNVIKAILSLKETKLVLNSLTVCYFIFDLN